MPFASLIPVPGDDTVASQATEDLFGFDRTNFFKKLFGEGIAGDQNVAGMWLKYGVKP
jgi:hypothetical protein